jgi:hypothetical protein
MSIPSAMESQPLSTLTVGLAATRGALADWFQNPWRATRAWLAGSALAAGLLLIGTLVVAEVVTPDRDIYLGVPPVTAAGPGYVLTILGDNLLVLALHSMACVAGFIAGSSLPHEAARLRGIRRVVNQYGARFALAFVAVATAFSMSYQVWLLGTAAAGVGYELHVSPALLLVALLPHAAPELLALFLPLAAWVIASRRGTWDRLLAASLLTTALAIPILVAAATWETYGAPHLIALVAGH